MPLEYESALVSSDSPRDLDGQEEEREHARNQRLGHRHRISVKPGAHLWQKVSIVQFCIRTDIMTP